MSNNHNSIYLRLCAAAGNLRCAASLLPTVGERGGADRLLRLAQEVERKAQLYYRIGIDSPPADCSEGTGNPGCAV